MDLFNENDCRKLKKISKNNSSQRTSESWFKIFKNSFKSCKNRRETKKVQTNVISNGKMGSKVLRDILYNSSNAEQLYFTDEYLDSFNSKSFKKPTKKKRNTTFKDYGAQTSLDPPNMKSEMINALLQYMSNEPYKMENILLIVVEDYINGICEQMLIDKMRSVYRKIENWHKNPLTRPGLKTTNSNHGGNITEPEKYLESLKGVSINKVETITNTFPYREKEILVKNTRKVTESFQKSYSINNQKCGRKTPIKTSKRTLSPYHFVEGSDKANISKNGGNLESKNYCNVSLSRDKSESSTRVLSIRCDQNKSGLKNKRISSDSCSMSHEEGNSSKSMTYSTSTLKCNNESLFKCSKTFKKPIQKKTTKDNHKESKSQKNSLKISNIINVDIEPCTQKNFQKIEIFSTDENCADLTLSLDGAEKSLNSEKKENDINNKNNAMKIRRSVTFLEPRNSSLPSPYRRDTGFGSSGDIQSVTSNPPSIYTTKSEELNCDHPFDQQNEEYLLNRFQHRRIDNAYGSQHSNLKFSRPQNDVDLNSENNYSSPKQEKNLINSLSYENKIKSISAIVVSLQSTPSLSEDNHCCNSHNLQKKRTANAHNRIEKESYRQNNFTTKYKEAESKKNILPTESKSPDSYLNYSVVDIDNRPKIPDDTDLFLRRFLSKTVNSEYISENSSLKSSSCDGEVVLTNNKYKNEVEGIQSPATQNVILAVDESDVEEFTSKSQSKPSMMLSKMKTANFSSSSIVMEDSRSTLDSVINPIPSSCVSFYNSFTKEIDVINATAVKALTTQYQPYERFIQKKYLNNLLKHTVASKQKCRLKASNKAENYRHSMKFSTTF